MARGVNKVILIGNVGQDPEVSYLPSGVPVANLSLATSETWKDKNTGEQKERTEWHRLVIFNKLAEIAQQYVKKGSKLYIEGQNRTRKWQDQSGQDRYITEIFVNELQMLDSMGNGTGDRAAQQAAAYGYNQAPAAPSQQPAQRSGPVAQQQSRQQNTARPSPMADLPTNYGNQPQMPPAPPMDFEDDLPF